MSVAYVDTSALVAIAFGERGGAAAARRLSGISRLLASNLLEAELRAAFVREGQEFEDGFISGIEWVLPDRTLAPEFTKVLDAGHLRGADLWHVAVALYVTVPGSGMSFITLDRRQRSVAAALGFLV